MALTVVFIIALLMVEFRCSFLYEATLVNKEDSEVCYSSACQEAAHVLLDTMDTSVDPCNDFFRYACGAWQDRHLIPDERSSYSVFDIMIDQVHEMVAEILKNAVSEKYPKPVTDAVVLFQGCTDTEARETQGLTPLKDLLISLGGWPMINPDWSDVGYQWQTQVATIRNVLGIRAIFSVWSSADPSRSTQNIVKLGQGGFGLSKSQLRNTTSSQRVKDVVAAYKNYIISTAKLLNPNVDEVAVSKDADDVIQFESALVQADDSKSDEEEPLWFYKELNNIAKRIIKVNFRELLEENTNEDFRKCTISKLQKITKNEYFKWIEFFNIVFQDLTQVTNETEIIVYRESYIERAIKLAHNTNPRILANYLGWVVLRQTGYHTTKDFRDNSFNFDKVQHGVEKPEKLEMTCVIMTTSLLGYAVGRLYVDTHFAEEEKCDAEKLIEDIRAAYEVNLNHITWMDSDTKNKALEKLRFMINFVGYPEWIKNDDELSDYYESVQDVKEDEFFASYVKVKRALVAKGLGKWNQSTDRTTESATYPTIVNAFYSPSANVIKFPAGILNPPFYRYGTSPALNYGAIGSIIAHEISHGYDNRGSHYGKEGNKVNWWSIATRDEFKKKADCFEKQYSSCVEPMTNMSLDGEKTLGDNIADNGGVRNAFMAFQLQVLQSEENEVVRNKKLPGVSATPEQLFFLGYASTQCGHSRKELMEWIVENDAHAPRQFRVNVPLSNSRAFSEAFNCPVGSRMNPETKCQLW